MTSFRDLSQIAAKSEYRERKEVNREPLTVKRGFPGMGSDKEKERAFLCAFVLTSCPHMGNLF